MGRLADGVLAYRQHPVHRDLENPPAVWSEGNTRLLDYGATHRAARARGARAVLVVPSLINRWEVLDLTQEKSLLRAMAAAGLRPYLVDWGTPNADERRFDTTAYVARLERALAFVTKRARRAPAVMGYCMGGTLTVALAARQPRRVAGLALLAAPWDFHADRTGHAFLLSAGPMLARVADQVGELPVDILQTLFWSLDPWLAMKKFGRFLGMDQQSASAREFVLLEDWLNEGAPLAGPTARECLVGWYGDNQPGTGQWTVGGRRIVPSKIGVPSLVMIPSGDRIVPPLSAAALAEPGRGLRRVTRLDLPLGHIGMVVSGRARDLCWTPLIGWLRRHSFQALVMAAEERSIDWRQVAVWAVLLTISVFAHAHVDALERSATRRHRRLRPRARHRGVEPYRGRGPDAGALLDASPLADQRRAAQHRDPCAGASCPSASSIRVGMAALRLLWFSGILGEAYSFPLTFDRLAYEFAKDIISYGMLSAAVMALRHLFARPSAPAARRRRRHRHRSQKPLPERFAVRKRGKEIMVEVADIDWIEAAGNYAVLHVGGDTLEIRSTLTKLEGELDPKRFVRVHKSYVVNVARIAEVTPWISGDWRIRLQDGAEVNLSRRYRQRFEALVPVRS